MKILVTNDDGFQSDGLRSLVEKLSLLFDVTVIVPSSDKSGIGAAFTLQTDIKIKKSSSLFSRASTFIVDGTPSDCVCIGMEYLQDDKFDLLISGINAGSNLGLDCISSGTVSAAMMGSLYNIPSIAISVCAITDVNYSVAADIAMYFAKLVRDEKVPFFKVLNINVPNLSRDKICGIHNSVLGGRLYVEDIIKNDKDNNIVQIGRKRITQVVHSEMSDINATDQGYISVSQIEPKFVEKFPSSFIETVKWPDIVFSDH